MGVDAHFGAAAIAAFVALSTSVWSERGSVVKTAPVAGFIVSNVRPVLAGKKDPSTKFNTGSINPPPD